MWLASLLLLKAKTGFTGYSNDSKGFFPMENRHSTLFGPRIFVYTMSLYSRAWARSPTDIGRWPSANRNFHKRHSGLDPESMEIRSANHGAMASRSSVAELEVFA